MTKIDQLKNQSEGVKRKREIKAALEPFDIAESDLIWVSINDSRTIDKFRDMFV